MNQLNEWLLRNRVAVVVASNVAVALACLIGAPLHGESIGRALYAVALFALCTAPLALLSSFTSRYILLAIFMGVYYEHFGAVDLQAMLVGEDVVLLRDGFLTRAEFAVLMSGVLISGGYVLVARALGPGRGRAPRDWMPALMLIGGVALWVAGICATAYLGIFVAPERSNYSMAHGLAAMGALLTFAVMLATMAGQLGLLIIAYGYARYRGPVWAGLMAVIIITQLVVGFLVDVKGTAFIPLMLVIVVRTLVDNRLPLAWVVGGLASLIVLFPIYQANRVVMGELGYDRLQALGQIDRVIELAVQSTQKEQSLRPGERTQSFVERGYVKDNVEQVIQHVGTDLPFLHGESLSDIPLTFVPRFLLPDKEHLSIGQLFARKIGKQDSDVFISISFVGDLYWNFGWPGVICGMLGMGLLLGLVGVRFGLEQGVTLTGVLVLLVTVQNLCLGFESEVSAMFSTWLRSMAAVVLLHVVFAKRVMAQAQSEADAASALLAADRSVTRDTTPSLPAPALARPRFPNLMT